MNWNMSLAPAPAGSVADSSGFDDTERERYFTFLENAGLWRRGEKRVTGHIINNFLAKYPIDPSRPFGVYDVGAGDGTVLSFSLREIIKRLRPFGIPLRIVIKEFSGEDVLVVAKKLAAIINYYPLTTGTISNLSFAKAHAVDFSVKDGSNAKPIIHETFRLESGNVETQLAALQPFAKSHWGSILNSKKQKVPEKAVAINLFHQDMEAELAGVIPQLGVSSTMYHDVVIISQGYAAGAKLSTKVNAVGPSVKSLVPGGLAFVTHWFGDDDGDVLLSKIAPQFHSGRHSAQQVYDAVASNLAGIDRSTIEYVARLLPNYRFRMPAEEITAQTVADAKETFLYAGQVGKIYEAAANEAGSLAAIAEFLRVNRGATFRNEMAVYRRRLEHV